MPNRTVHEATSIGLGVALVPLGYQAGLPLPYAFLLGLGSILCVWVNPDLDVAERRRQGMWRLYWYPYGKAVPHRHWISHMPIIGTAVRLIYLLPLLALSYLIRPPTWEVSRVLILGLALGDTLHWLLDITTTSIKRRF